MKKEHTQKECKECREVKDLATFKVSKPNAWLEIYSETCWQCRQHDETMDEVMNDYMRYGNNSGL